MGLKKPSAESVQPPAAMADDTEAATAEDTTHAAGSNFDNDAGNNHPLPATTTGGAVSTQVRGGSGEIGDFQSAAGKLGFGAFPQVKLDKASFVVGTDTKELDGFLFRALSSKSRWIYKANKETFFFSYDKVTAQDGRPIDTVLREWQMAGTPMKECREYQEVYGYIMDGEYAERMVVLSVPPASGPRFAGIMAEVSLKPELGTDDKPIIVDGQKVPLTLDKCVIKVSVGPKITTKAKDTFYPWAFSFHCQLDRYVPDDATE